MTSIALSSTFALNLELERLCLAKKTLKDYGFSTRPRVNPKDFSSTHSALVTIFLNTAFNDWFKKIQKKIVPVEVEGIPQGLIQTVNEQQDVVKDKPKRTSPHKGSIMVMIRTRESLRIQKKGLDYQGLKTLVEKLEGLC